MLQQLQYKFDVEIHRIYLPITFKCRMQVWWAKGNRKIKTKKDIKVEGGQPYYEINEKLSILGSCHYNNGDFEPKDTTLKIILFKSDNVTKIGGKININLTQILSTNNVYANSITRFEKQLTNGPLEGTNSKITYTLSAEFIKQGCNNNNDSIGNISFQADNFAKIDMTFRPPIDQVKSKSPERNINAQRTNGSQENKFRPLQFSFNPLSNGERDKERKELIQIISQLKGEVIDKRKQIEQLRMKNKVSANNDWNNHSEKIISLMNELNSAMTDNELLKKQIKQYQGNRKQFTDFKAQIDELSEEKKQLHENYMSIKQEMAFQRKQMANRYEMKKKGYEQMREKIEMIQRQNKAIKIEVNRRDSEINELREKVAKKQQMEKENSDIKLQVFKKQSEIINAENKYEEIIKEQSEKYLIASRELKEIRDKHMNLEWKIIQMQKQNQQVQQHKSKCIELEQQKQKLQRNNELIQNKFKEKQQLIEQIQNQFKLLLADKDAQVNSIRQKYNMICKRMDENLAKQQSTENLVSELKVKGKNLEEICQNLEKEASEKDELIEKAKEYLMQKEKEIEERNEFIAKAKNYIIEKEQQLSSEKQKMVQKVKQIQENVGEESRTLTNLKNENNKYNLLMQQNDKKLLIYNEEINKKNNRISDLQQYINSMQERLEVTQDEFEQINRKNKYQQETLEELIKKNLDMEIQLNIKNCEIETIRSLRKQ